MAEERKTGYATTTYKIKLYTKHMEWLALTKEKYNQVLAFYYFLLLEKEDLLHLSNQRLMRQLEILTIGEKRKPETKTEYPIPYTKVPLYFRRAAINGAVSMVRSQITRNQTQNARKFNASPVYYQGMYKDFNDGTILLKLWNGKSWVWVKYTFKSTRKLPENAKCLSPVLKINNKSAMLHIPVVTPVQDIRTVKQRIIDGEKICAISFPNNNNLAVLSSLNRDGSFENALFIKGGNELKHRRKYYLGINRKKCQKSFSDKSRKDSKIAIPNEKIKRKIANLNDAYAHKASREIVNYCLKHGVKIIAVPKYQEGLKLNKKGFLKANDYDWIGRRIIRYLEYKAFQAGIVVTKVPPHNTVSQCYICGNTIRKYNKGHYPSSKYYGGRQYLCPLGHKGNTVLNAARNIGKYFGEKQVYEYVS